MSELHCAGSQKSYAKKEHPRGEGLVKFSTSINGTSVVTQLAARFARCTAIHFPATCTAARARDAAKANKTRRNISDEPHRKAECALRDHRTLGRYLRQLRSGRLVIDRAAIRAEERLDGKYLLSTSDPDLSAEDVALGYKNLLEAERGFRDLKSTLELRPVFHRLEPRIRAHVLLCWLALLLVRVAERRCHTTWRRIATELGRLHAVTLQGSAGTVVQTTPPTAAAASILAACGIDPPPRITHLHPA